MSLRQFALNTLRKGCVGTKPERRSRPLRLKRSEDNREARDLRTPAAIAAPLNSRWSRRGNREPVPRLRSATVLAVMADGRS